MNAPLHTTIQVDRATYIGGGDAAPILGVSPYKSILDVFLLKLGLKKEEFTKSQIRAMTRGKREEPRIVDDLIEDYGVKVVRRSMPGAPNRYVDPEHDFLAAEIDFEFEVTAELLRQFELPEGQEDRMFDLVGTVQNGEVKTVHHWASDKFGEEGTDEVPVEYYTQAQHGMMVSQRQLTMFVVRDGFTSTIYWVLRDDHGIEGMRAQEVAFWNDFLLTRTAPEARTLPDVYELFRRVPPKRVEVSTEIADAVHELAEQRDAARVAETKAEDLKFRIGVAALGEGAIRFNKEGKVEPTGEPAAACHVVQVDGQPLLEIVFQSQMRLDGSKVKKEFPDVAEQCQKPLSFYKFQKPKKPKSPRSKK